LFCRRRLLSWRWIVGVQRFSRGLSVLACLVLACVRTFFASRRLCEHPDQTEDRHGTRVSTNAGPDLGPGCVLLVAKNRASVFARSLLTAGSMQKSPREPRRCRTHEARAVSPRPRPGIDAAALGAERPLRASATIWPAWSLADRAGHGAAPTFDARSDMNAGLSPCAGPHLLVAA
jgi:hypothetical protein